MDFASALVYIRNGARVRRAIWTKPKSFGLYIERAGSGNYASLGYGYGRGQSQVWRTAALDVLANDWEECTADHIAPPRQVD